MAESQRVTIDGRRYDLGGMTALDYSTREVGGVRVVGAWYGPRSRRLIVHRYSIWEDPSRPGCVQGDRWSVYEPTDEQYSILVEQMAARGVDLPADLLGVLPVVAEPTD